MTEFAIIQSGKAYDISELVSEVSTAGRKGAAGRSMTATLLDAPEFDRAKIDVYKGCQFIFSWEGREQLRGLITEQGYGRSKKLQLSGRDNLIYFANNADTFNYKNKTATEIFLDICGRFGIPYGSVIDTAYPIPALSIESGKLWDALLEALSKTYKATGIRYYIRSHKGLVSLIRRRDEAIQWVVEDGKNLTDYQYSRSIESLVTRVKMINDTGAVVAQAINAELEKRLGIFQSVIQADSELNAGQLQTLTDNTLALESVAKESLSVTGIGIPSVVAGSAVRIVIPDIGVRRSYYVDEDTHTFKGLYHSMQLTLNKTNEL